MTKDQGPRTKPQKARNPNFQIPKDFQSTIGNHQSSISNSMFKYGLHLLLISSISLLTTGCMVFGFGTVKAIPVGGPPPSQPPQAQAPTIHLEYSGGQVAGVEGNFSWHTANSASSGSSWGGTWPPNFPGALTVPVGQSVDIVVSYGQHPAALWVAELNGRGDLTSSTALTSTSNVTAYPLSSTGRYALMVTAQWSYQDYVTYYFSLEVQP